MKASELIAKAKDIAANYKTLYVMGCFGAPLTGSNVDRYCKNHQYNKQAARTAMIKANANKNPPVFGFDCVNLIKGIVWGWCGDASKTYGGAKYNSNGCPDYSANGMIKICTGVTTNFSNIIPGEALWMEGHIGIYIGDGLGIECTPAWKNKVQITAVGNIGKKSGYSTRTWTKYGKLPFIDYSGTSANTTATSTPTPATPSTAVGSFKVGDTVNFTGTVHYTNAGAATGKACKPGKAKVTGTYNGKHPYQLTAVSGGGSTVCGWVDAAYVKALDSGSASTEYNVQITCTALNIRKGPGTNTAAVGCIRDKNTYTIVAEQDGFGQLKDGRGWLSLKYLKKV